MNKDKKINEDDGHTIANMNVDGMPWYTNRPSSSSVAKPDQDDDIGRSGNFAVIRGVLAAALLVAAIFSTGFFLFILFCTLIWFK